VREEGKDDGTQKGRIPRKGIKEGRKEGGKGRGSQEFKDEGRKGGRKEEGRKERERDLSEYPNKSCKPSCTHFKSAGSDMFLTSGAIDQSDPHPSKKNKTKTRAAE
jgi:hypothetical protein